MTERESMAENRDCGADAAAYVLGALEPEEARGVPRAHGDLRRLPRRGQRVSGGRRRAAARGTAAAGAARLKRRVMAGVRAEPRGAAARAGEAKLPDSRIPSLFVDDPERRRWR